MTDLFHAPDFRPLLASVLAAPRDDAPRLVLADYAQECGMTEWAEFVRWQVRNKRETADAYRREGIHLSSCGGPHATWFSGHAAEVEGGFPDSWVWTWHRGFVSRLRMPADDAFDRLGGLLENWPITQVVLIRRLSPNNDEVLRVRWRNMPRRRRDAFDSGGPLNVGDAVYHRSHDLNLVFPRVRFREDYPRPFETHPQLGGDVLLDPDDLREQVERFQNSLQRYLASYGGTWNPADDRSTFSGRTVNSDVFARLLGAMRPDGLR